MDDFPTFGGLDAKRIIVCNGGDSGVAGAAVESAGGNDSFFRHFINLSEIQIDYIL
jgi:hypothetical protein